MVSNGETVLHIISDGGSKDFLASRCDVSTEHDFFLTEIGGKTTRTTIDTEVMAVCGGDVSDLLSLLPEVRCEVQAWGPQIQAISVGDCKIDHMTINHRAKDMTMIGTRWSGGEMKPPPFRQGQRTFPRSFIPPVVSVDLISVGEGMTCMDVPFFDVSLDIDNDRGCPISRFDIRTMLFPESGELFDVVMTIGDQEIRLNNMYVSRSTSFANHSEMRITLTGSGVHSPTQVSGTSFIATGATPYIPVIEPPEEIPTEFEWWDDD